MTTPMLARVRTAATPQRTAATAAVALAMASIAAVASLLDGIGENGDLAVLDRPTLSWLVGHRDPVLTALMSAVSVVGGEVVLSAIAVLSVAALAWRRHFDEALLLGLALSAAETLSLVLKHVVGRARPPAADVVGPVETTLSFPSGHTIGTATFALALAYLWWRRRPGTRRALVGLGAAGAATAVMAVSRLYLGDHSLTDVLGSVALAGGVLALVVLVDLWWRRRRS
ncbi:MAG TPA: phosphatase PAP2 family protein [Cellulomonas sp.]